MVVTDRKGGRAVQDAGLLNQYVAMHRGFKAFLFRHVEC